jgi:hypothetical protein
LILYFDENSKISSSLVDPLPLSQDQVDAHIFEVASELGLAARWSAGQALIRDIKSKEKDHISRALIRYQKPTVELE